MARVSLGQSFSSLLFNVMESQDFIWQTRYSKMEVLTEMHIEIFENVKPGEIRVAGGKILRPFSPHSQVL